MAYSTRLYSNKQEKHVAKVTKGKRVSNSGAAMFYAGDVKTDKFLIECKTCVKPQKSFCIKKDWINKTKEEAFSQGKSHWALCFNFGNNLDDKITENLYIISEKEFLEYQRYLEEGDL